MTDNRINKISKILNLLQIIFIILSGLAIIAFCLYIYFTGGDEPYSREIIGKYFNYISIPIYITLALILTGFIFRIIYPNNKKEKEFYGKPVKSNQYNNNMRIVNIVRLCIFALATVFIVYGAISGGTVAVLTKAVNICTECIGLG